MGCGTSTAAGGSDGNSAAFNYEAQLLADHSHQYSVIVDPRPDDGEVKNCTPIYRHPAAVKNLSSAAYPEEQHPVRTIWDGFNRGLRVNPSGCCLGTRPYILTASKDSYELDNEKIPNRSDFIWSTYSEVHAEAQEIGIALRTLGIEDEANIGIWSKNRHEYGATILACYSQSFRTVPLYDSLGKDSVTYIMKHADIEVIFSSMENIPTLLATLSNTTIKHKVKHLIIFDYQEKWHNIHEDMKHITTEQHNILTTLNISIRGYQELRKIGAGTTNIFPKPATPENAAYIMYTSGTTGDPKGAIIGHGTLLSSVEASRSVISISHTDVHLSYLPLAHIFEAGVVTVMWCAGAAIGFSTGVVKKITSDIQAVRPTAFFGVPRVYQRIYQVVFAGINGSSSLKKSLALKAYARQEHDLRQGKDIGLNWWPNKILGAIRHRVGLDRCRYVVTGAAPTPPYIMEFLKIILQCNVVQGYGMTESCCVLSVTEPNDYLLGHVGAPLRCNEMKLVDVEEMNYLSTDKPYPRGEIWVRGNNIFHGYYKDDINTQAAIKENGWLATGDIGRINPNGTLSIIDRRKNIFKLSQGEYIAVEYIESVYSRTPVINQIWVYGNSYKSTLLGVVSPSIDYWHKYATQHKWYAIDNTTTNNEGTHTQQSATTTVHIPTLMKILQQHQDEVRSHIITSLKEQEKILKGFERVHDWLIEYNVDPTDGNAFTTQNNLMTPTFKIRRVQLLQKYKPALKALYEKNGEPDKSGEKWPGDD